MVELPPPKKRTRFNRRILGRLLLRSSLAIALIALVALTVSPVQHATCSMCQVIYQAEQQGGHLTARQARFMPLPKTEGAQIRGIRGLTFRMLSNRERLEAFRFSGATNCGCESKSTFNRWFQELKEALAPTPPQTAAPANPAVLWRNQPRIR